MFGLHSLHATNGDQDIMFCCELDIVVIFDGVQGVLLYIMAYLAFWCILMGVLQAKHQQK